MVSRWVCEIAFLVSSFIYIYTIEPKNRNNRKMFADTGVYLFVCVMINLFPLPELYWIGIYWTGMIIKLLGYLFLVHFLAAGIGLSWFAAMYYGIWAFISWQILYELCQLIEAWGSVFCIGGAAGSWLTEALVFVSGYVIIALTIGRSMPDGGQKSIGPKQLGLAGLTFVTFQIIALVAGYQVGILEDRRGPAGYLAQLLLAVVLYLQNELFKKSEMRQELEVMNLLWKKEQEQYRLSRENIALINQKAHDLKHQIRAVRNSRGEDIHAYLDEIEDSVEIYEAIVKTGNEVLDTILTEKSLYCKDRGIMVSCVADGSQMDFINTVDLYAILGNAIDNAIEAVEKFEQKEKRQIDVMIYRKQQFLAINVVNPVKEKLIYEDELPVTTKGDRRYHGFGLKSIKHILKKYDGFLSIRQEDECFSLMILIPVPVST